MPQYLSPGVYVEEREAGSRPIEGVGTAVAAFVGFAAEGPFHTPTLVTNWTQYTKTFGGFVEGCYLAARCLRLLQQRRRQRIRRPGRPATPVRTPTAAPPALAELTHRR